MLFAQGRDALSAMSDRVAELLLAAADAGASAVPVNPFELAELMGIRLRPNSSVAEARLVSTSGIVEPSYAPLREFAPAGATMVIEYNPTRPRGRLRYSVAHELAHALFPDANRDVRSRTHAGAVVDASAADDSWQLELLCNVGAAELLMPTHAIEGLLNTDTDIDFLMAERARFNVSTEAMLRRFVHATARPVALAAFSRTADGPDAPLRCEYVLGSRTWVGSIARGDTIEPRSLIGKPTAIGQTAKGVDELVEQASVQAVGIPPYPGRKLPRVLALIEATGNVRTLPDGLTFRTADIASALDSGAPGPVVVAHVVNDAARAWGTRGVAAVLRRSCPDAASAFRYWSIASDDNLTLGNVHQVEIGVRDNLVTVVSLVAQQGFGASATSRLSYVGLAEALDKLAAIAARKEATVHLPRIGAGQAGGRWDLIEATIERTLLSRRVPVVVYTKPAGASSSFGSTDDGTVQ